MDIRVYGSSLSVPRKIFVEAAIDESNGSFHFDRRKFHVFPRKLPLTSMEVNLIPPTSTEISVESNLLAPASMEVSMSWKYVEASTEEDRKRDKTWLSSCTEHADAHALDTGDVILRQLRHPLFQVRAVFVALCLALFWYY